MGSRYGTVNPNLSASQKMMNAKEPNGMLFEVGDAHSADNMHQDMEGCLIWIDGAGVGLITKAECAPNGWSRMQDIYKEDINVLAVAMFAPIRGAGAGNTAPKVGSLVSAVVQSRGGTLKHIKLRLSEFLMMDRQPTVSIE